jgi:hypothetical protein
MEPLRILDGLNSKYVESIGKALELGSTGADYLVYKRSEYNRYLFQEIQKCVANYDVQPTWLVVCSKPTMQRHCFQNGTELPVPITGFDETRSPLVVEFSNCYVIIGE